MAGTTGLEPATSDVTGRGLNPYPLPSSYLSARCGSRVEAIIGLLQYVLQSAFPDLCQYWHIIEAVPEKADQPRKLIWLVDSLDRLAGFPRAVRLRLGFGLYQAQIGQQHESAKMLRGFSEAVWQVRADDPSGTYRALYVTQLGDAIYVLHAFQKKSTSCIATPQRELDLIRQRLKLAHKLAGK